MRGWRTAPSASARNMAGLGPAFHWRHGFFGKRSPARGAGWSAAHRSHRHGFGLYLVFDRRGGYLHIGQRLGSGHFADVHFVSVSNALMALTSNYQGQSSWLKFCGSSGGLATLSLEKAIRKEKEGVVVVPYPYAYQPLPSSE